MAGWYSSENYHCQPSFRPPGYTEPMDWEKITGFIASALAVIGVVGLGLFALLQNLNWREDIEKWAERNHVGPIIELVRLLTN